MKSTLSFIYPDTLRKVIEDLEGQVDEHEEFFSEEGNVEDERDKLRIKELKKHLHYSILLYVSYNQFNTEIERKAIHRCGVYKVLKEKYGITNSGKFDEGLKRLRKEGYWEFALKQFERNEKIEGILE
jgi:hypothetical protein